MVGPPLLASKVNQARQSPPEPARASQSQLTAAACLYARMSVSGMLSASFSDMSRASCGVGSTGGSTAGRAGGRAGRQAVVTCCVWQRPWYAPTPRPTPAGTVLQHRAGPHIEPGSPYSSMTPTLTSCRPSPLKTTTHHHHHPRNTLQTKNTPTLSAGSPYSSKTPKLT